MSCRQIYRVVLSVFVVLCISVLSGGGGFVSTSVVSSLFAVVSSLFAAGYAFDFGGDPMLVEACRIEFAIYRV